MRLFTRIAITLIMILCMASIAAADVPTSMNVQGRLTDSTGTPLPAGPKTFGFRILDSQTGGIKIWPATVAENQTITTNGDGLWNASVGSLTPLPASVFSDSLRWLEITVDDGINPVETLPRVRLNTAPYAFRSETSRVADTALAVAGGGGGAYLPLVGGTMTGPIDNIGDPAITMGKGSFGSANTNPGTGAFVAGTNNSADAAYSVVSGGLLNTTPETALATTISGGNRNEASGTHSSVGGGRRNFARGAYSVVAGGGSEGGSDSNSALGDYSAILGGVLNITKGICTVVGGGRDNSSSSPYATVSGGQVNSANGLISTIAGGEYGSADGSRSTVGGGANNHARGSGSTVAGGGGGTASDSNSALGDHSTVSGGHQNVAAGTESTISGGIANSANNTGATVGGGSQNTAHALSATIGGGSENSATADDAAIGGGTLNTISGNKGTISGGKSNGVTAENGTISGGQGNLATSVGATIGGGHNNRARGRYATVAGGGSATASDSNAAHSRAATVSGGQANYAMASHATVGGGHFCTADGPGATVAGGNNNTASGTNATIPGGKSNKAIGAYSFAAGRRAEAIHSGTFIWADSRTASIVSDTTNRFIVRAANGIWLGTNNAPSHNSLRFIETSTGGYLSNSGNWTNSSDRNVKENFHPVDGEELLERISHLPISEWNYIVDDDRIKHIGPMAQDFQALFGLGQDDKSISTVDPAGIALAAIKELHRKTQEIDGLKSELADLRRIVERMQDRQ